MESQLVRHPKARIIAMMHQSGGVGKTTDTCVISEGLAIHKGLNVLCIDLDPQIDTTDVLVGVESREGYIAKQVVDYPGWPDDPDLPCPKPSIRYLLLDDPNYPEGDVIPYPTFIQEDEETGRGKVDLIAGDKESLSLVNTKFHRCPDDVISQIHGLLHSDAVWDEYDVVIIDTSPTETPLFEAALRTCTHVMVPINFDIKNLANTLGMLGAIEREQTMNRTIDNQLEFIGFAPCMREKGTVLDREVIGWLKDENPHIGEHVFPKEAWLPNRVLFKEYWSHAQQPRAILDKKTKEYSSVQDNIRARTDHVYASLFGESKDEIETEATESTSNIANLGRRIAEKFTG